MKTYNKYKRVLVPIADDAMKALQTIALKEKWSLSKTGGEAIRFYLRTRKVLKG